MLGSLLGSVNKERILLFLYARDGGYPREIARFFNTDVAPIQRQMNRMEAGGIIYSQMVGRTKLYTLNPRYSFLPELKQLLDKALSFYPADEKEALLYSRQRPRRTGKPL